PKTWQSYAFHINYRACLLFIQVSSDKIELQLKKGTPLTINVYQKAYTLTDHLTINTKTI
ncbi:MAG: hypothetical protein L0I89_09075, partial [Tetragenococcus halophilus]|nr:hypothetical protein [Tetragenococcus halophilus]MDN6144375.1 hypothetical protein [Tetragenococcus halophilus]MDN6154108.1 hypothetical protein [Tetragenococcus halophilus]MDN6266062.1 hypothetical protein [Tetragenococcus halophilus]MDN6504627.1 hypothetical protein [Tetragenococcus halophilus]